ncbi:hypothetical protein [Marivirga harenae]|uniref:hypothetical protein n=1 Tax=Marivirga harenae TaxID=2010992 RepID=UPI0026E023B3|nr:hypothetical protein [Marivirga harenae]WKV12647.1 hypothetical protein Q3Y49_02210 [Marivirga harenae]
MKVYISSNYRQIDPISRALEVVQNRISLQILRTDYFNIEEQVVPQIIETIERADVVIADISNENPNIYYEVGVSHALGKPVIFVSQTDNFNRFSLLSYRFYQYEIDESGINNLAFRLEKIIGDSKELEYLKPIRKSRHVLDYQEFNHDNNLNRILNLKGASKYYEFEKWIYELLIEIPDFEPQYNEQRSGKEYDFIVWNSNELQELKGLGNPIPIEVKATKRIENNFIHSLISKAISQGFRSFILITTATLSDGNLNLIKNLKEQSGITILVIDFEKLRSISTSKDLVKALIQTYREFFIY